MAYPIKPICEEKDKRTNGTSIIYLQYCYTSGKRTNLNTGIAIQPKFWNKKQSLVKENLPPEFGTAEKVNEEITRQKRLAEDLIKWAAQNNKSPIGEFVKQTYKPDLSLGMLNAGINAIQFNSPVLGKSKLHCNNPIISAGIIPTKPIILPFEAKWEENPMIFPGVPINSPLNGRPWPNVFDQINAYIEDKKGHVSEKTIGISKNVGDHLRQFEQFRKHPITFLSFNYDFYESYKHFLTYDYIQPRKKKAIKGMKRNSISTTIKQLRIFVKDRIKRKVIPPMICLILRMDNYFQVKQDVKGIIETEVARLKRERREAKLRDDENKP